MFRVFKSKIIILKNNIPIYKAIPTFLSALWDIIKPRSYANRESSKTVKTVSVVIPTFNEQANIPKALNSLADEKDIIEVIVADGGSKDETLAVAESLRAKVVETQLGRGIQIYEAVKICKGDIILILHADCRINLDTIGKIKKTMNLNPSLIGGSVGMSYEKALLQNRFIAFLNNTRAKFFNISFGDQCQFFRRDALKLIGGFPKQMLMEDVELSLRMNNAGPVAYIPDGVLVSVRGWWKRGFLNNIWTVISLLSMYIVERHLDSWDKERQYYFRRYYGKNIDSQLPSKSRNGNLIIIFGRYPVPGNTKTRLIPELGPAGAADLSRELTEKTIRKAKKAVINTEAEIEFCSRGGTGDLIRQWLGKDISIFSQEGSNLGERMFNAFKRVFTKKYERVILCGTDIPGLKSIHFEKAFSALNNNDIVVGPSEDGGYWLIGMKQPHNIFNSISWGTENVFKQTISAADRMGLKIHHLETLNDIDTKDDLYKLVPRFKKKPFISVVIPALNEAENIEKTINSALGPDSEVIVVDGVSIDNTVEIARQAGAILLSSKKGRAIQQNLGAARAKGKTVLFLHADTILPKDYIKDIFQIMMNPQTALGAFKFKTDLKGQGIRLIEHCANIRSGFLKKPYGDQGLFLRKKLFDSIGGFPEVPIAEDLFLVKALAKHGQVSIAPKPAITSGRRWQRVGIFKTTLINYVIYFGCQLGVPPDKLRNLYK